MDHQTPHRKDSRPTTPARAPLPDAWWDLALRTRRLVAAGIAVGVLAVGGLVVSSFFGGDGRSDAEAFVAELPDERVALWEELAACESETRWDLDTGNGYFGGLQFSLVSWDGVDGVGSPALASREEQIMRAEMLFELQGWGAWPRCSSALGLG